MAEGISLHLGVKQVDPYHYAGFDPAGAGDWAGCLLASEQDAVDLQAVTAAEGFAASVLLADAATVQAASAAVTQAARSLGAGDMFVLTYSGYGGTVPDRNSDQHWNERTWALHNRQMPEDELMSLLGLFSPGVRIFVVDDSSSIGTVRRAMLSFQEGLDLPGSERRTRDLPLDVAERTYQGNSTVYDEIQFSCTSSDEAVIEAAVLTMTGFGKGQIAMEGPRNSLLTKTFLRVWDCGEFQGSYNRFLREIAALMPVSQVPRLDRRGSGKSFERERPLTI